MFNSAELIGLPEVLATQHLVVVLDELGEGNGPEIVYVTGHTAGATSATIVRGREGTAAVEHAVTTPWNHSPIASDWPVMVATFAGLPSTGGLPYPGMKGFVAATGIEYEYQTAAVAGTAGWYKPWGAAWGVLTKTLNPNYGDPVYNDFVTAEEVLLISNAVACPKGRKIKVTAYTSISPSLGRSLEGGGLGMIRRGTTVGGPLIGDGHGRFYATGAARAPMLVVGEDEITAYTASLRYVYTGQSIFSFDAYTPSYIIVEDAGPV